MKYTLATKVLIASIFAVAGTAATVTAVNAAPTTRSLFSDSSVISAIKSGDLAGFKAAAKTVADKKIDTTTQDQLGTMKTRLEAHDAIEDAIKNNDFTAYQKAMSGKKHGGDITQAQFDKIVAAYKAKIAVEAKLTDAAKANDKALFTTILTQWHTAQQANRPSHTDASGNVVTRPEPTAEQKQARIDAEWTRALEQVKAGHTVTIGGGKFGGHGFGGKHHGKGRPNGVQADMQMQDQVPGFDSMDQLDA